MGLGSGDKIDTGQVPSPPRHVREQDMWNRELRQLRRNHKTDGVRDNLVEIEHRFTLEIQKFLKKNVLEDNSVHRR